MRIRYFSDLHLEFIKPNNLPHFIKKIPPGENEVCILAGDIGSPYLDSYDIFMNFMSKNFKKTFVITGNHEYYNKTKSKNIEFTNAFLNKYFQKFDNISFLHNSFEYYENYCFIGTTLWSKITDPFYEINDVYSIPNLDYSLYNQLNSLSVAFLKNNLANSSSTKNIIITHHIPSNTLIDKKYKTPKMIPYNQWFYCDLDNLIDQNKDKIKCWIYGHTHNPSNNLFHGIPFLCNPIGYPNENDNINFKTNIILDEFI
jgi:predicted phosphohydrolase